MKHKTFEASRAQPVKRVGLGSFIGFRGMIIGGAIVAAIILIGYWALLAALVLCLIRALS